MIHYSMRLVTSLRPALIGLFFCLVSAVAAAAPATVLIRVPPAMPLPKELAPLLEKWRLSGQVAGVLFLTHGRPDNPAHRERFEAFAVLEFLNERSCDIWEKEWAPALPVGLIVRRADVLAHGEL